MFTYVIPYFACLISFIVLDGGWLAIVGPRLYKQEIGSLLSEKPRLAPAALFYLVYVGGALWLAILPNTSRGWLWGFLNGAILGVVAYGTYDLTCASTMKIWSIKVTLADMTWGAVATGVASVAGVLAAQAFRG